MVFSGRAHPELAEEVASDARHRARADQRLRLRQRRDLRALRGVGARLATRSSSRATRRRSTRRSWSSSSWSTRSSGPSAKRITVVMPFYGYARQDKKHRGREPISARLMADLFKTAGANRLMAVDLHTAQIQGFFDGPVDHLDGAADPRRLRRARSTATRSSRRLARRRPDQGGRAVVRARWAARRWRSSTRRATSTAPTRPWPTGSSVRSRAGSASSSTT